jgi:hypothetical protein
MSMELAKQWIIPTDPSEYCLNASHNSLIRTVCLWLRGDRLAHATHVYDRFNCQHAVPTGKYAQHSPQNPNTAFLQSDTPSFQGNTFYIPL